jgi:hypothetical protein
MSKTRFPPEKLSEVFFTKSVTLPVGLPSSPKQHDDADTNAFYRTWRAFQASIGFDPDDPATW